MAQHTAPRGNIMNTDSARCFLPLLGLLASGCASTPVTPALPQASQASSSQPAAAHQLVSFDSLDPDESCAVVRRGLAREARTPGSWRTWVRDARLAERWPDTNYGHAPASFAGMVHAAERATLLAFSLPEIPAGAEITRARLTLHKHVCGGLGVSVHRVTRAWDEATVTWNRLAGGYEQTPVATLPRGEGGVGRVSLDVTSLAREWHEAGSNHGIVLRQDNANTSFATSEASEPEQRPTLEICWRPTSFAQGGAY
jgi:hypothetical protein